MKTKGFACAKVGVEDEGVVEAIVSVYDVVDSMGERVKFGAFAKSLERRMPKVLFGHRDDMPIGKTMEAAELPAGDERLPESIRDKGGLYVKAKLNLETQRGREAFSDLKHGVLDEFSIGYIEVKAEKASDGIIDLLELDLREWSPVVMAANPATELVSAKAAQEPPAQRAEPEPEPEPEPYDPWAALAQAKAEVARLEKELGITELRAILK